jgi:glucose-6-phosphate isomerase
MTNFADKECYQNLSDLYNNFKAQRFNLKQLFNEDANRSKKFSIDALDCHLDYSKNWITTNSLTALCEIADHNQLAEKINALFSGKQINISEKRAVMHTALRDLANNNVNLNGTNISDLIRNIQTKIQDLCLKLHNKQLLGFSGKPINTIVNIGIGGSDLGSKMVYHALKPYWHQDITCYFISNIDPSEISHVIKTIDPDQTLFIISSKSFNTTETITNATTIRNWLLQFCELKQLKNHFIAITNNIHKAIEFGIDPNYILPIWDWVGGRYSLWSAMGLVIALGTNYTVYTELLKGANKLDQHFKTKPWPENIPVILALIGIGYINFAGCQSHALLPYCQNLNHFTDYIQQLEMESNGKSVNICDEIINYNTAAIIWGATGTNGQHAFHQLLHQGTHIVPCDFIVPVSSNYTLDEQQQILVANAFAQAKTLLDGYHNENNNFTKLAGNRPSNTLLLPQLTPYYLGILIAIYEHKVFTQGVIWNINSFDQWGVEHGKVIANEILPYLTYNGNANIPDKYNTKLDASTYNLITKYNELTNNVS